MFACYVKTSHIVPMHMGCAGRKPNHKGGLPNRGADEASGGPRQSAEKRRKQTKMAKITINDLLEAGCHFGHQTRRWNPRMKKFVYGAKNGITIIDLTKTMRQIADACNFLQKVVIDGGEILFVGTKRQIRDLIKELADETGMYHVSERWLGGTLTNNVTIRKSIAKMTEIDATLGSDSIASMKKKEVSSLSRRAEKLHRDLDGIAGMKKLPAALVVVDVCNEINAVREANKLNIPIVAIVDTNGDPSVIDYPVAANDDAVKSVSIITGLFKEAIKIANEIHLKKVAEERDAAEAAKRIAEEKAADEAEAAEEAAPAKKPARKAATRKTAAKKEEKVAVTAEDVAKALKAETAPAAEEAAKEPAAKKPAAKKPAAKKPAAKKPAAKKTAAKAEEAKAEEAKAE